MKTRLLILIALAIFSVAGQAQIGPGEIDNSFNSSGIGAYGGNPNANPLDANADGNIYKSKVYGAASVHKDKILIVGRFTSYNGVAREYIARLNADGTLDTSFNATTTFGNNQYIYCVEILSNNKILIGGGFTVSGGGITFKNMARLNEDGSLDTTFCSAAGTTRGTNGVVHAFCPDGSSTLIIGGEFSSYSGTPCGRVIKLTSTGALSPTFISDANNTPSGEVRTIVKLGQKTLVGGFFTSYKSGGTTYNQARLVRLNTDGTYDSTFNLGGAGFTSAASDAAVFQVSVVNSGTYAGIYVGGRFDQYNGVIRKGFVKLNPNGVLVPGFNGGNVGATGSYLHVFCFAIQPDNKFVIGGNFTQWNGSAVSKGMIRLNPDGTMDTNFLTGTGFAGGTSVYQGVAVVRDINLQSDSKIIVGGDYLTYDGTSRRMISRIKTRECSSAAVFYDETGWDNNYIPTNPADQNYYVSIASGTCTIPSGTNVYACELDIKPGATLIIDPNASITVRGNMMNNGTFIVNDKGSLVQVRDNAVNTDLGDGVFQMYRKTQPVRRFDYTYWSSPVEGQLLHDISPLTLADKFYKFNTPTNAWSLIMNGAETMAAAKGYIVRAPQNHSTTVPSVHEAQFIGRPHNGVINTTILKNGSSSWNLLGNPYPSAIDVKAFLDDSDNASKIGGTVYLWTHTTNLNPANGVYNYVSTDYIAYNKTANTISGPNGIVFNGKVAAGQSFFVEGLQNNVTVSFKNSMRANTGNAQFLRTSSLNTDASELERSRFWLNVTNAQGGFHQMAVGYVAGATNDFDRDFDGKIFSGSNLTIYSLGSEFNYVIQGRALPFNDSDEIAIGYSNPTQGMVKISLPQYDGLFQDQAVYLVDMTRNVTVNLKNGDYEFSSAAGTFNNRFKIVFKKNQTLAPVALQTVFNVAVAARPQSQQLRVAVSSDVESVQPIIDKVEVFDVTGKLLFASRESVDSPEFETNSVVPHNQLVLVKTYLKDGQIETKKVLY